MRAGDGIWTRPGAVPARLDQNQPEYASQVAKANGLQGSVPGHLDPTYQVGITLDDYTRPEFWWLRRGLLGLWGGIQTAVAAQFGWVGIQGAVGTLTVVERLVITNPTVTAYQVLVGLTTATPSAGAYFPATVRDTRGSPNLANQCATTGGARAAAALTAPATPLRVMLPANSSVQLDIPWVLTGALFLSAQCQTLNLDISATFTFRERSLLPAEA